MKNLFVLLFALCSFQMLAQTGIGTSTPNASAKLDVYSDNKGFLPPRVTLTSVTDNTTIPTPAEGLLVYNKGSVGLQSGYYYWNGANWAIIATSTVAGSGVVASDLVKLYSKVYSTAVGDIAHSGGFSFTVPVSGRYLFDFSSSGYVNQASQTITFKIRQNTTDLATDLQTGNNNNVHVEYNGKIEVNLLAGVTYNAVVTSTGSRDAGDYDRVYMKQVAGNLPVNVYPWVINGNDVYNTTGKVGIGTNAPAVSLDVNGAVQASTLSLSNTSSSNPSLNLKNGDPAATYSDNSQIRMGWSGSAAGTSQYAQIIHTRHNSTAASNAIDFYLSNGTANNTITSGSTRAMTITSPGDVEITGKLNIGNASGNVATKVSGFVTAGTFLALDNLQVTVTSGGSRGLSVAAVTGSFVCNISGWYAYSGSSGNSAENVTYTTTPSGSVFGWSFGAAGNTAQYHIMDLTNNRFYRVTMAIGSSYINNFISIERLY